ncbi:hypothetical protein Ptr902_00254 [Pyrenophora tritici-repentis]|nr:hypothetical protein Ptr902_00254 [Pyrenophora tritici-repentis]
MSQQTEARIVPPWGPRVSDFDYQRPVTPPSTLGHQGEGRYRDSKMEYPEFDLDPDELGEKEGSALLQLRRFLQEEGSALPDYIEKAIQEVDDIRDLLGSREADYEAAENGFDVQEIKYESREAKLIDNLLDDLDDNPIESDAPVSGEIARQPSISRATEHEVSQKDHSSDSKANKDLDWWHSDLLKHSCLRKAYPHTLYLPSSWAEYPWGKDLSESGQIVNSVGTQFQQGVELQDEKIGIPHLLELGDADHGPPAESLHISTDSGETSNAPINMKRSDNQVISQHKGRPDRIFTDADSDQQSSSPVDVEAEENRANLLKRSPYFPRHTIGDMSQLSKWIKGRPPFLWIKQLLRKNQ